MHQFIARSEEDDDKRVEKIAEKMYLKCENKRRIKAEETERTILVDLVRDRFPHYYSKHYLRIIKQAIRNGELGGYDRFNNPIASYQEVKKFLHN